MKHRKHWHTNRAVPKEQLLTLKVFTEGKKTEVDYIKYWHRIFRNHINVVVGEKKKDHGVPSTLIDIAIKDKKHGNRQSKSTDRTTNIEYWCVFDVDTHPNLRQAIQKAEANGIRVAVSNPCIELWFLLHFREQESYISKEKAQSESKSHLQCGKSLSEKALKLLEEDFPTAKSRAINLRNKHRLDGSTHEADGSSWRSNPSSDLFELIDRIVGDKNCI